ncbi:hypothetical protein BHE74_00050970 [Ensete ventricosum]|nr:hypothetical protein GW17_00056261 [Ensete ventricosum]RWW43380.1 hypothetical protein BHE74_00050970 [Ensete ventricosum]
MEGRTERLRETFHENEDQLVQCDLVLPAVNLRFIGASEHELDATLSGFNGAYVRIVELCFGFTRAATPWPF